MKHRVRRLWSRSKAPQLISLHSISLGGASKGSGFSWNDSFFLGFFSFIFFIALLLGFFSRFSRADRALKQHPSLGKELPPFTHTDADSWINSKPLTGEDLRGSVVLLDFWTFACWNCYRSFPWLHLVEEKYGSKGLRIIGVHTPELDSERDRGAVIEKIKSYQLTHPVMLDNDHAYWKAIGNSFWPAFYLVDKQGRVRAVFAGETHAGDAQAKIIEETIEKLLAGG